MTGRGKQNAEHGFAMEVTELGVKLPKGRGIRRLWGPAHWVFRGLSFELKHGETIALLGHNGAGKSTLLRTLAGILEPDEGELIVEPGLSTAILAPGTGFDGMLTGRENIYNVAIFHGFMPDEIDLQMDDILKFSELGDWIDQPVATYSTGMRARLGFSLSLYLAADVLMIDETLSAGDAIFREKAKEAVEDLIKSDRTVILVSHNPNIVRNICTKGFILDGGRMAASGDIDEILDLYESVRFGRGGKRPPRSKASSPATTHGAAGKEKKKNEVANSASKSKQANTGSKRKKTENDLEKADDSFWQAFDELQDVIESVTASDQPVRSRKGRSEGSEISLDKNMSKLRAKSRKVLNTRKALKAAREKVVEKVQQN